MTLQEWTAQVVADLREAGFHVEEYEGFPLAPMPGSVDETVRLLKFTTSLATDRFIYKEGMLFVPGGLGRTDAR